MTVTNPALPLYAADIERTCLPLEQATMLPGAAYTDHAVLEWERANFFRRGWICAGHVEQVSERGQLPDDRRRRRERARDRRRRRPPARVPEHVPAPRRAAGDPARGPAAPAPVPVPRVDLRVRRLAQERAVHRRPDRLRPEVLLAARGPPRGRRGARAARPLGRGAAAAGAHRRPRARTRRATGCRSSSAARGSSTTSTPTGRRSARTTASACTARACTRSSTGSRTTCRGETIEGAGLWCGGSMTLADGVEDDDRRRRAHGRKPIDGVDVRSILYFLIFPNTLVSLHPDYVMLHTLWPRGAGPDRGRLRVVLRARGDRRRRASTRPTRSSSGTRSTARTGTSARSRSAGWTRARSSPAATRRRRTTCTTST